MFKNIVTREILVTAILTALICFIFFKREELIYLVTAKDSASWTAAIATAAAAIIALWLGLKQNSSARKNENRQAKVLQAALTPECTLLLMRLAVTKNSLERLEPIHLGQHFDKQYLKYSSAILNLPALEVTRQLFNELHRLPGEKGEHMAKAYANLMLLRGDMKALVSYKPDIAMEKNSKKASAAALSRANSISESLKKVLEISDKEVTSMVKNFVDTLEIDGETLIYNGTSDL